MLKKLFRYDFRSVMRIWWILAVSALGVSVVGAAMMKVLVNIEHVNSSIGIMLIGWFLEILCFIALAAFPVVTIILVYYRFYRNLYTDEGYLTFTLPVRRATLLMEKTLHAAVWMLLSGAVIIVCIMLFVVIVPSSETLATILKGIGEAFTAIWEYLGAWTILYVVEGLLFIAFSTLFSISLVHYAITIGAVIAKKYKLLAGVGLYYGISSVLGIFGQILFTVLSLSIIPGIDQYVEGFGKAGACGLIALLLLTPTAIMAVVSWLVYMMTLSKVERKLNLP